MSQVFVSYSHEDKWIMRLVVTYLRQEKFDVWVDEKLDSTLSGWRRDLDKFIQHAACVIALLSPTAANSNWVADELETATTFNRPILPVLVSGDEIDSIPFGLRRIQRFDIRTDYAQGLKDIALAVSKHTQRLPIKVDGVDLSKLGSVFWAGSDSRLLRCALVPRHYNAQEIREQFLQVYHHAQRLNLSPIDLKRLNKFIEATKEYKDEDWTDELRRQVESEVMSIFRGLARITENADIDFEAGPKWKSPST